MGVGLAIQNYTKPLISLVAALQHDPNMDMAGRAVNENIVRCTIFFSQLQYWRFSGLFKSDGLVTRMPACVDDAPDHQF